LNSTAGTIKLLKHRDLWVSKSRSAVIFVAAINKGATQ